MSNKLHMLAVIQSYSEVMIDSFFHTPAKDPPPPQDIQDMLIKKAELKRKRKNQKRLNDEFARMLP